jgi:ADP-ribose 1''-phosphate phosphatase
MTIDYIEGDLFSAVDKTGKAIILLHACNCEGAWGSGIAAQFRKRYRAAYKAYQLHCQRFKDELIGSTGLIRVDSDEPDERQVYIGCLFTSRRGGKRCDSPDAILENTKYCLTDLQAQLAETQYQDARLVGCKFNSGIFKVPWTDTAKLIDEAGLDMTIYVRQIGDSSTSS